MFGLKKYTSNNITRKDYQLELLQTKIWMKHILLTTKYTISQLSNQYCISKNIDSTNIVFNWNKGKSVPNLTSVKIIDKICPGSRDIFYDPIFELLDKKKITSTRLQEIQESYRSNKSNYYWKLYTHHEGETIANGCNREDLDCIFQRGGEDAFRILLSMLRESEVNFNEERIMIAMNVVRAFPSLMKNITFQSFKNELLDATKKILNRYYSTFLILRIYDEVLEEQINDPHFQPYRELRKFDFGLGNYPPMKDCVDYRGWETSNSIWYYF